MFMDHRENIDDVLKGVSFLHLICISVFLIFGQGGEADLLN